MTQPRFSHDCAKCQFLGIVCDQDLYICGARVIPGLGPSVVARFGNDGPDYTSMPWWLIEQEAEKGLVPPPILEGASIVLGVVTDTLAVRSKDFNQFLRKMGSDTVLAEISVHANRILGELLRAPEFPYDPAPFLALRVVALLEDRTVIFGLTAKEA
jgi:hypothetical protein